MEDSTQTTTIEDSSSNKANAQITELETQIRSQVDAVNQVRDSVPTNTNKEISAATVGRMMGLATVTEIHLLESKLDLLGTKVANVTTRLEKVLSILQKAPTGSDMERIDVQIGALRTLVRETLTGVAGEISAQKSPSVKSAAAGATATKPSGVKIMTNATETKSE